MVAMMVSAPLGGCLFTEEEGSARASNLSVSPEVLEAGVFQQVELSAKAAMSVYVPYLVIDPVTGFVQNSTVIDLLSGTSVTLEMGYACALSKPILALSTKTGDPCRDSLIDREIKTFNELITLLK